MSQTCEVVTIQTENGPVQINKSDYDASKHKLVIQEPAKRGRPAKQ
jgi:hypothetical protein